MTEGQQQTHLASEASTHHKADAHFFLFFFSEGIIHYLRKARPHIARAKTMADTFGRFHDYLR
jgi:hypothetical protein